MIAFIRRIFIAPKDDAPTKRDAQRAAEHSAAIVSDVRNLRGEIFSPTGNIIIDEIAGVRHRRTIPKVSPARKKVPR